ncbi:MAG: hypothetical protein KBD63_07265 [Bacteriovoracaceae bacterium]|nr:hypothetical protein [Bacteriovoracaceae bacterium]
MKRFLLFFLGLGAFVVNGFAQGDIYNFLENTNEGLSVNTQAHQNPMLDLSSLLLVALFLSLPVMVWLFSTSLRKREEEEDLEQSVDNFLSWKNKKEAEKISQKISNDNDDDDISKAA